MGTSPWPRHGAARAHRLGFAVVPQLFWEGEEAGDDLLHGGEGIGACGIDLD